MLNQPSQSLKMSALKFLKDAATAQPICNFDDLPIGDYLITSFARVETMFGFRLRVDIGDKAVFMPARFCTPTMTDEKVEELNSGQYLLRYKGKNKKQKNRLMVDFDPVEEYIAPLYYK